MFIKDHEEKVFDETFQRTYADIVEKYETDPNYDVTALKEFLESMYVYDGHDWDGRGEIKAIRNNAIITALEVALDDIETGKLTKKEPKTA